MTTPAPEGMASDTPRTLGCDYQGHEFGATYPDSVCIDGFLWDADSCDEPGGNLTHGGDIPCPQCNADENLAYRVEGNPEGAVAEIRRLERALTAAEARVAELLAQQPVLARMASDLLAELTALRAELAAARTSLAIMTKWLEANRPDVFRSGIWDALSTTTPTQAEDERRGVSDRRTNSYGDRRKYANRRQTIGTRLDRKVNP